MSPRRPRRHARRRTRSRGVVPLVGAVIVLAVLVGGLTQVSTQSKGYDADSERALAGQAAVLADESNATSTAVLTLMGHLPTQTRQSLQATLDGAVQQSASQSAQAQLAATSMPSGSSASAFEQVFDDRARSLADLRSALDGLLGLQPLAGGAVPPVAATTSGTPALLSAGQATTQIAAAGALLVHSDSLWSSFRRAVSPLIAPARVPPSVWVKNPGLWRPLAVAAQVDLLPDSPTLAASHYVLLRTVRLTPPALPPPSGTPTGVSIVSPTSRLSVSVVLANQGAADEPHVTTELDLTNQTSAATSTRRVTAALALGASVTLPSVVFRVQPGADYALTVQIDLPPGQTLMFATDVHEQLRVAPTT